MAKGSSKRLTKVNGRFYTDDVRELKSIATAAGLPWQFLLRELVHRAIPGEKAALASVLERNTPKPGVIE